MAYGDYGKTTELEAVNTCLAVIGEQPVNSIPTSGISEAIIARDLIYEISREIQTEGLNCNTEENYSLVPDANQQLILPANTIDVDPVNPFERFVERGGKLYNPAKQCFNFTETVKVKLILFLPFNDLPEHVRRYITIRAARIFQERFVADTDLWRFTEDDEQKAQRQCMRKELNNADVSFFDNMFLNRGVIRRQ